MVSASLKFNETDFITASVQEKIGIKSVAIHCVELPLLIFGFIFCGVFLKVIVRTRCFHQNLRFLLGNFALSFLIVIISRFMIIMPLLFSFLLNRDVGDILWCRLAKALHDCGLYVGAINIIVIVIERTVATVRAANYETKKTPILGIFMVNCQWLFALIFVWYNQMNAYSSGYSVHMTACQREYISKVLSMFLFIIFCCDFVSMAIFFILLYINKRKYSHRSNGFENHYALSARYQIAENIRTTRLLYPLVTAYLIGSVISICLLVSAGRLRKRYIEEGVIFSLDTASQIRLWGHGFDVLFDILTIIFPHLAIYGHQSLLREFKKLIFLDKESRANPRQPRTIDGDKLIRSMSEERQLHFKNLEDMWNMSSGRSSVRKS